MIKKEQAVTKWIYLALGKLMTLSPFLSFCHRPDTETDELSPTYPFDKWKNWCPGEWHGHSRAEEYREKQVPEGSLLGGIRTEPNPRDGKGLGLMESCAKKISE